MGRTRGLVYALLLTCAIAVLFGPQLAERALGVLGCSARFGAAGVMCEGGWTGAAAWLAPWQSAAPPVETAFVLLEKCWLLLALWGTVILISHRADARKPNPIALTDTPIKTPPRAEPIEAPQRPATESVTEWVKAREAEQRQEVVDEKRALVRRVALERSIWGGMALTSLALLLGLVVFCFAFGMPILGGFSADALLSAFSCKPAPGVSAEGMGPFCGFWINRLAPYRQPFLGALLSPVWLFTQFHDLLLVWIASSLILLLAPLYRLGWVAFALKEQALAVRALFVLIALCSIAMVISVVVAAPR